MPDPCACPSQKKLIVHSCVWGMLALLAYTLLIVVRAAGQVPMHRHALLLSILGAGGAALVIGLGVGLPRIARSIAVALLGLLLLLNTELLGGPLAAAFAGFDPRIASVVVRLTGLRYLLLVVVAVGLAGAVASRVYSRGWTTRLVTVIGSLAALLVLAVVVVELVVWLVSASGLGAMPTSVVRIVLLCVCSVATLLSFVGVLCAALHGAIPWRPRELRAFSVFGPQLAYYLLMAGFLGGGLYTCIRFGEGVWPYLQLGGMLLPELCALFLSVVGLADTVCQSLWLAGCEPTPEGPMRPRVVEDVPLARVARARPKPVELAPDARPVVTVPRAIEVAPKPEPPSVEERLTRLKGLADKGLISEAEYRKRKEELLKEV